jgi:hypothetical protein
MGNVGKLGLYTVKSHRCAAAMREPKVFAVSSISVELRRGTYRWNKIGKTKIIWGSEV